MQGALTIDLTRPLLPTDWLDLWRTVYFDLPLTLAGQPGSRHGERQQPSTAIGGGTGSMVRNRLAGAEVGDPDRNEADSASDFLEGLEGCFA